MERNVLIIEDEPRAVNRLERLLSKLRPEWKIAGVADSIDSAEALINANPNADVAFFDIQLADGLSFDVLEKVKPKFPIIFVTAYDHYAVRAFEHFSLDYILKPSGEDELLRAIEKLERTFETKAQPAEFDQLIQFMQNQSTQYKQRFLSKIGDKLRFFETSEIHAFFSENKMTYLQVKSGRKYPIDLTLDEVANQVDPAVFFRINRKFIVSAPAIEEISAYTNSRLRLVIKEMEEDIIIVARERTKDFKDWLDN